MGDTILQRIVTSSSHNLLQDNYLRVRVGKDDDQMLSWCYKSLRRDAMYDNENSFIDKKSTFPDHLLTCLSRAFKC